MRLLRWRIDDWLEAWSDEEGEVEMTIGFYSGNWEDNGEDLVCGEDTKFQFQ